MDFDIYFMGQNTDTKVIREDTNLLAYNLGKDLLVALAVYYPTYFGIDLMEIENYWLNRYLIFGDMSLNHALLTSEIFNLIQHAYPLISFFQVFVSDKKIMTIGISGNFRIAWFQKGNWLPFFNKQIDKKVQIIRNKIYAGDLLFISHSSFVPTDRFLNQISQFVHSNCSSRLICEELIESVPFNKSMETNMIGLIQIK